MNDQQDLGHVRAGLHMSKPPDPAVLADERATLARLANRPLVPRLLGSIRLLGPGYLQSAMTLGGGTAVSSLLAGALFGYELLWVAPIAMLLGVFMLSVVAHQTLSTGLRPFEAMRQHAGPFFAWGWAIGALLASVIWHFPQYALASTCLVDLCDVAGVKNASELWLAFLVLAWAIILSSIYGLSTRAVKLYENLLKIVVWGIVIAFGWVVLRTGVSDWGALLRGFVPSIPDERNGVAGFTLVLSGLAAAVGINMVFLYPYSLLARGWGREHRQVATLDLATGMFLPYFLAASLVTIAAANTIHLDPDFHAKTISVTQASQTLASTIGPTSGRVVFGLGVLGMALSTITLHMLCAGFVAIEVFGWPFGSVRHRLATLIPAVGVFGPVFWSKYAFWLAVPTSILCGALLPIAYIGFTFMQRDRSYLGDDQPRGARGKAILGIMVAITVFLTAFFGYSIVTKVPGFYDDVMERLSPAAETTG